MRIHVIPVVVRVSVGFTLDLQQRDIAFGWWTWIEGVTFTNDMEN
jgi:hypothetical protein